jgi:glycosyltransferase involved in cell wall biosynthesis
MRIAIYHNIPDGGAKRALFYATKLLSQQGHILDLYTFDIEGERCFRLAPYVRKVISRKTPIIPMVQDGYPLIINTRNIYRQIKNLHHINTISQEFAELINTGNYDMAFVTHCRYFQSPNILKFLTIPTVYYCQEPLRKFYEPSVSFENMTVSEVLSGIPRRAPIYSSVLLKIAGIGYWFNQYLLKRNDQKNVQYAHHILVNSYYSRESIYRVYGKFARVNYLGVDAGLFRPLPEEKKENLILSVGRYYPVKQHHFVLQSLSHIPEDERSALVIIGNDAPDYTYKAYLRKLAKHFQISLQLLDNISDDELVTWYNRAKVVVFPPILEPFGLVPLEAMACQTPVVGIREGGIRETIVDGVTGFLTERDEKEFAQAIHTLLHDAKLRQKMGENGRAYVLENWTWEKSVKQLVQYFCREIENKER